MGDGTSKPAPSAGTNTPPASAGTPKPAADPATTKPAPVASTNTPAADAATQKPPAGADTARPAPSADTSKPVQSTGTSSPAPSAGTEKPAADAGTAKPAPSAGTSSPAPSASTPKPASGGSEDLNKRANANYHIYDTAHFPDGRTQQGSHPGYPNVQNLYCMGALQSQSSEYFDQYGWIAAGPETGIKCGECIQIRNVLNGKTIVARRVDEKGEGGFDFDYERTFKPLDSGDVNFKRGNMDHSTGLPGQSNCS